MKTEPSKTWIRARRRAQVRELALELSIAIRSSEHDFREDWQRQPIDRTVAHRIEVTLREVWPNGRTTCSCGFDSGWLPLWDAEQRASWHRRESGRQRC